RAPLLDLLLLRGLAGCFPAGSVGLVTLPVRLGDPRFGGGLLLRFLTFGSVVGEAQLPRILLGFDADGFGFGFCALEAGFLLRLGGEATLLGLGPRLGADRFRLRLGDEVVLLTGRGSLGRGGRLGVGGG